MTWRNLIILYLAIGAIGCAHSGSSKPTNFLNAKYPRGIPWRVTFSSADGRNMGSIDMVITSDPIGSCLADMSNGVRVRFISAENLAPTIPVSSFGIATFEGDTITLDLSGGTCDAYVLMSGKVASDGSSSGTVRALSLQGGDDLAQYYSRIR